MRSYASLDVRERQVRVVEGVGLVTATMEAAGDHAGERFEGTYCYTHVHVHRDGAWLLMSAHACGLFG
ncbi:MAG: nuclear transport factor 2 family protein [Myxococcaceae bacterium]|nr:MAG: nuclear transport factor 2 family protein [Myxococcaceae bacterium]